MCALCISSCMKPRQFTSASLVLCVHLLGGVPHLRSIRQIGYTYDTHERAHT